MVSQTIKELFEHVASWPADDQQELAQVARDIEARRLGIYHATFEELTVLDEAERSGLAGEGDVKAAFRSFHRE